jgi:formylglycine-generating enzyme required for sulfatase activity
MQNDNKADMEMKLLKKLRFSLTILLFVFALIAIISILNMDVLVRFYNAHQNGMLTLEKVRYDIASFNLGRRSPVTPITVKTSPLDGMAQVFVPAGEYLMGRGNAGSGVHSPQHIVHLDAFWIDKYEVSNAMYLKCMKAGVCTELVSDNLVYKNWIYRNHPVTYVVWEQAQVYCEWAGRRLPIEAEWEKAARGTDGRLYPWGNEPPNPRLANFNESLIHEAVSIYRYPLGASPYGALNMSGNAREWVADWYDPEYYLVSPYANPQGPADGEERSLRSGSYNEDWREISIIRRYRHQPQSAGLSRGFRCAQDAD